MRKGLIFLLIFLSGRALFGLSLFPQISPSLLAKLEYGNYVGLASVSYRAGDREQAKTYAGSLLKKYPDDPYANHFLGAMFLMDGNIEAALKYWNRIGEPRIEQIQMQPLPAVDPVLMDRAFVMPPASPLTREDYLETESRLRMMGIFQKYEFQLRPRNESKSFDLVLRPQLRKGSLASTWKILALVARGAFTETIEPEFHNIRGTTIGSTSIVSWDEDRHRFSSSLSIPFDGNPSSRLRIFTDHRSESWRLGSDFHLLKSEAGLEASKTANERWSWKSGAKASHHSYEDIPSDRTLFPEGWLVEVFGGIDLSLIRIPEKRLMLESRTTAGTGKFLRSGQRPAFFKLQHSFQLTWFPRPADDDVTLTARAQFGRLLGDAPFSEFFSMGADRLMDLRLRAHRSTIDPYGENPVGPGYLLFSWDVSKTILKNSRFRWRLVPYSDIARIHSSDLWDGPLWFFDVGAQSGLQVFDSIELILTYGKDLRRGRNVVYVGVNL